MKQLLLILPLLTLTSGNASALTDENKGLAIAMEADRRDTGYGDIASTLTMVLVDREGRETVRELRRQSLEVSGDGDKNLMVFDIPRDVKGTAVLSYNHALEPDEQWIFLPALKRVKRIATVNKSGPFMGSEFAFEDIATPMVEKYTYEYLREEDLDGRPCFVLELTPAYEHSGYARLIQWLDKAMHQPLQIVYYDRKDALLKTLRFEDYQQYLASYWRPGEMVMENHQTGKSTRLVWNEYRFRVGLTDRDFSRTALKRAR